MEKRIMKIYQSSQSYKTNVNTARPCITLQGDWVESLGFSVGKKIVVAIKEENKQKIITLKLLED